MEAYRSFGGKKTDDFIQAPYLTIKGEFVTVDTTPGEVSTSAAASTTVPVQETTATKITSTEVITTEPSTTGPTTSIKITTQPHTTTEMLTSTVHVTSGATVNDITDNSATTTQQLTTTNGLTSISSLPSNSTQTTTTDQVTSQNNQHTSRSTVKSVCSSCVCNHVINMSIVLTDEEAQKLILIRQNLTVDKTNLSSFLRTKISAPDNRTSAVGLGVVGIAVMCSVFGGIVIIDMSRFRTVFYKVNEQKS